MRPSTYEVRFFSVGNNTKGGDAIFIRFVDENSKWRVIVIDGGYTENGDKIKDYMGELHLDTIDLMVNTHPDLDHISGLLTIMDSDIKVDTLLYHRPWKDGNIHADMFTDGRITDNSVNRRLKENFVKAYELEKKALEKGCQIESPEVGTNYFGCYTILGPTEDFYQKMLLASDKTPTTIDEATTAMFSKREPILESYNKDEIIEWNDDEQTSEINETSIVSVLLLKDCTILFTGDAGKQGLEMAYMCFKLYYPRERISLLQLPHHGSRRNINPDLIQRIGANKYFISEPV